MISQQSKLLELSVTPVACQDDQKDVKRRRGKQEASPPQNVLDLDRPEGPGPPGRYHSSAAGVHVPGTGQEQQRIPLG